MDSVQILLIIVLVLTTIFLAVVGLQLVLTLIALRKTLKNISRVIDGVESAGVNVTESFSEIGGFISGFRSLLKIFEVAAVNKQKNEHQSK
jgi:hypothetical protein